jgi:SAM-dependent methyltransferase
VLFVIWFSPAHSRYSLIERSGRQSPIRKDTLTIQTVSATSSHAPDEALTAVPLFDPHEEAVAAFWNSSYSKFKRMWGLAPSRTATSLIDLLNEERKRFADRIEIADLGCGYGRDTFAFGRAGFDVLAADIASHGLALANQDYRKMLGLELPGNIRFVHGTIRTVIAAATGRLDGISCHRTLHLMKKEGVIEFAQCAAELVRPGGFISIGTRSPRDFDPETMEWVDGQTARYKDPSRDGQLLTFLDEPFLRFAFDQYFDGCFSQGLEEERAGKNTATRLIYLTGTRKVESTL